MSEIESAKELSGENLEQELLEIIKEKNQEIRWMQRKLEKTEKREAECQRICDNYSLLENSVFGKRFVIPILKHFKKYKGEEITKRDISLIARSKFFDEQWYMQKYPDLKDIKISAAEHYVRFGWKENRNPSSSFSTREYLELNSGVRYREICPLLHYEKAGKYEGKQYRIRKEDERADLAPSEKEIRKWKAKKERQMKRQREKYRKMKVVPDKIVFCNFQHKYTCNTKYICEELLRRKTQADIVWLYDPKERDYYEYPRKVRLIPFDSARAKKEIATAKIIIDNGVISFGEGMEKKEEQVSICTWHGSLGFKKLGADSGEEEIREEAIKKFSANHDFLISNSTFEEKVFRSAHWPDAEIWRLGHARNDILIDCDAGRARKIKLRLCVRYGIPFEKKLVLYAPTFRDTMLKKSAECLPAEIVEKGTYDLDFGRLTKCLGERFGGEWVVLIRHHYINSSNKKLKKRIPEGVINVTDYTDIQELMVAADAGVTDYSSWILDFIFTKKPGFLYTVDEEEFERDRGMYYPLTQSPFSVSQGIEELERNIMNFNQEAYEERIQSFLEDKGCIDDGQASSRIADKLIEILLQDGGKG